MKISILAFGIAKEIMNGSEIHIDVSDKPTVADLREVLTQQYPRLKELRSFFIAVNSSYAPTTQVLKSDDEIAIIPPVSGG